MYEQTGNSVRTGDVLAGKYRVDRVLGEGGMGMVVAASHLQLEQMVALKFIRSEVPLRPEIVDRFEREARIAVRLKSEHAARIIDVGRLESGSPYIVMEYLDGDDLARVLERRGALSVPIACDYVIQACDAISEAHGLGIVHRDLKPGNLFLANTSHGQQIIKVLDFGISKIQGPGADFSATSTQAVMGSPGYMSPEQMRSAKNVDGRTDIWSLGVILYELIAGRVPFQADTFSALCVKIAVDPHPPLPPLPEKLPRGFESVLNRALEKDAGRRFQSVAELAQALAPYASAQGRASAQRLTPVPPVIMPSAAYRVMLPPNANTLDAASGQARGARNERASRPRTLILAGAGLVAVVMVGIAVGTTRGGRHDGSEADGAARPRARPADPTVVVAPRMPIDAPVAPDAVAATRQSAPTVASSSSSPPATAPSSTPPVAASDAGVITPDAPHLPNKLRNKPELVDPFKSSD